MPTITVMVGIFSNGEMARVAIYGLAGGILFGAGGFVIGNLVQSYVLASAMKEAERKALEKELAGKMAAERTQSARSAREESRGQ